MPLNCFPPRTPNHYHGLHNRKNASTALTGYPSQVGGITWPHSLHMSSGGSALTSSEIQLCTLALADIVSLAIMEMSRLLIGCRPFTELFLNTLGQNAVLADGPRSKATMYTAPKLAHEHNECVTFSEQLLNYLR